MKIYNFKHYKSSFNCFVVNAIHSRSWYPGKALEPGLKKNRVATKAG